jgi:hypothetical protein
MDMDGFSIEGGSCGAVDCDDNDASINPGAVEICDDNIDNNCNGLTDTADMNAVDCPVDCTDGDRDGYSTEGGSCGAVDCDDNNAEINPAALEVCDDGVDNNCNGLMDSADGVCQNEVDDGVCELPWWRDRKDHHHDQPKCDCSEDSEDDKSDEDESDEDESEDESAEDENQGHRWWWGFRR